MERRKQVRFDLQARDAGGESEALEREQERWLAECMDSLSSGKSRAEARSAAPGDVPASSHAGVETSASATARVLESAREALARASSGTSTWGVDEERRLQERVLLRTTREDLGWRGELRMLWGFLRDSLRDSPALRVVAASLIAHLLALPVLGYVILREEEPRRPRITFELPGEREALLDLAGDEELEVPAEDTRLSADSPESVENARRRARWLLTAGPKPPGASLQPMNAGACLEIELLRVRTRGLEEGIWEDWLNDRERLANADLLQQMLWGEVLLDQALLTEERPPRLSDVLASLEDALLSVPPAGERPDPDDPSVALDALRVLALGTLARARSYGLWNATEGPAGETAGERDWSANRIDVISASWCALLEEAWGERPSRAEALPRDWFARGRND